MFIAGAISAIIIENCCIFQKEDENVLKYPTITQFYDIHDFESTYFPSAPPSSPSGWIKPDDEYDSVL